MNYGNLAKKKKKQRTIILITAGLIIVLFLIGGTFLVGKNWTEPNSNHSLSPTSSPTEQVTKLQKRIKELEEEKRNSSLKDQQEIKRLKAELKKNIPHPNPHDSPSNNGELKLTVSYFCGLGKSHMYIINDIDKAVLIDKENQIFPNPELTKKDNHYTATFLAEKAGKYHNQSGVYYFDKSNNNFTLTPATPSKNKVISFEWRGSTKNGYWLFSQRSSETGREFIHIAKNHPILKGGKLAHYPEGPIFTIEFFEADASRQEGDNIWYFDENNSNFEWKVTVGNWPDLN